jgi:hypothetical protein
MRKSVIAALLGAVALGLGGCASSGYEKKGATAQGRQYDHLECSKDAISAKQRVLAKGGSYQEGNAAAYTAYHSCARRHGYRRVKYQ